MRIGERLGIALKRAGKTQQEVAVAAGLDPAAVSKIITGEIASPWFATIEKIVLAAGLTWAEVFDEPRLRLSPDQVRVAREFQDVLDQILENDSKQKEISRTRGFHILREGVRETYDEVENLPTEKIPGEYQRLHANRAFRVHTDAMMEARIPEDSVIYAHATQNTASADGEVVVCRLNEKLYLRRLDLRGGKTILMAANPRYAELAVKTKDRFALVAVVCLLP
jgi:transcriptional regulator with XRE-family HTH domain